MSAKKVVTPTRPALRYHGGKWLLAPWILEHFPNHRTYVEPFGGAASVLLRKARSYAEVYNDLDGEIVNLFAVLRDHGCYLIEKIELTPFSRAEFEKAYEPTCDPIERARRTLIKSFMGFGSAAVTQITHRGSGFRPSTGFRSDSNKSGTTPARDWRNLPDAMLMTIERLQGVCIENRDAIKCMKQHDSLEALHYVDPPYVHSTRARNSNYCRKRYRFEMPDEEHAELAAALHKLKGMVVLSGYHSELYDSLYRDWTVIERIAFADGAHKRTECLWLNPPCTAAINGTLKLDMEPES